MSSPCGRGQHLCASHEHRWPFTLLLASFCLIIRRRPDSTLFPYTTLFRSAGEAAWDPRRARSARRSGSRPRSARSEEHTYELQSHHDLVCRLVLEKKKSMLRRVHNINEHADKVVANLRDLEYPQSPTRPRL